ncbi:hypothetical protein T4A_961, partial [Trichinella pseudospiralis]
LTQTTKVMYDYARLGGEENAALTNCRFEMPACYIPESNEKSRGKTELIMHHPATIAGTSGPDNWWWSTVGAEACGS